MSTVEHGLESFMAATCSQIAWLTTSCTRYYHAYDIISVNYTENSAIDLAPHRSMHCGILNTDVIPSVICTVLLQPSHASEGPKEEGVNG
jgi:hypothetical protein